MPIARIIGNVEVRYSRAAWWCRRVAVFAVVLAFVAIAAHRFGLIDTVGFLWVLTLVFALGVLALLLAAAAFQRVWYAGDRGGGDLTIGTLLGFVLLAPFGLAAWWAFQYPALNDISTDLEAPPPFIAAAAFRTPGMNAIVPPTAQARAAQLAAYPSLTGRRYAIAFDQLTEAVESVIDLRGWRIISPLAAGAEFETTFEALARYPILALPFDVAIRVTDEGNASYVDMRSSSRFGARDLGLNAALIEGFLAELDVRTSALAGAAPSEEAEPEPTPAQPPIPEQAPAQ